MRRYTVTRDDAGQRADRFLRKMAPDIPASLLQKTFRQKDVKCDGRRIKADTLLPEGAELCAYFPEKLPPPPPSPEPGEPYRERGGAALNVVYEDEHILVAHKPAGLPAQGDDARGEESLELCFRRYLYQSGIWKPVGSFMPSLCHRLDRQTEGLLLCAKSAEALRILTEKIRLREIGKGYQALVLGKPEPSSGLWRDYLYKDPGKSFVTVHRDRTHGAKTASLHYRVEETYTVTREAESFQVSRLDIDLHTGRTHQIRVQCASRGHPVLGDQKYGDGGRKKNPAAPIALCACRLKLDFQGGAGALQPLAGRAFTIAADFSSFLENTSPSVTR